MKKILNTDPQTIYRFTNDLRAALSNTISEFDMEAVMFSCAYYLLKAQEQGINQNLKEFEMLNILKNEDQNIDIEFIINNVKKCWKNTSQLLYRYDNDELIAFILSPIFAERGMGVTSETTPQSLVELSLKLLEMKDNDSVADLCSGIGAFLVSAGLRMPNAHFIGVELNTYSHIVANIRTSLLDANITLETGDIFSTVREDIKFDKIFSNYPFGLKTRDNHSMNYYLNDLKDTIPDILYSTSGDWIFNSFIISHLKDSGKAVVITTNGSTWNGTDKPMREHFVNNGYIETVISLPSKMFSMTSIPTSMMVLSKNNKSIRFIDASDITQKGRRQNTFSLEDLKLITDAVGVDSEISCTVDLETLRDNEYMLNPARYLAKTQTIENAVSFESIIKNITRGAPLTANQLDEMTTDEKTNLHYLMLANIQNGFIDYKLPSLLDIPNKYEKYCIKDNSLVLSKNGFPFKVAVANINNDETILANGNLYVIELDQNKALPLYIKAFFQSDLGIESLKNITVGAVIPNIGIESLRKLQIPLIPISKQQEFVENYSQKQSSIQNLRKKIDKESLALKNLFSSFN